MTEPEFQDKVLRSIEAVGEETKAVKTKQETLVADFDRLQKETKSAFEDLTKLKTSANDQAASAVAFTRKLKEIEGLLRSEVRMAFGDPARRISVCPEKRTLFNALIRAAVLGNGEKLPEKFTKSIEESGLRQRALGEDTSPGSTYIIDDLLAEIYDTLAMFGVWNTFAVRRLGTKITKMPVKTARPVANFVLTEAGTIADDTAKAGTSVNLEVEVIAALLNVSLQLVQDAEFDVTADVLNDFAEAYSNRLDHAAINAAGAANGTDGGMTGVFQGGTAATADTGDTSVEVLEFEDVTRCLLTVDPVVLQRPARWWMHPQILVRLLSIKDSNGRPIFLTAMEAPAAGSIGTILGYPVTPAHAAPSTNAASAKVAVFGDPNGNVVGVRQDFTFEASDHHRWNTFERSFRGVGRAGTKIRRAQAFAVLTLSAT